MPVRDALGFVAEQFDVAVPPETLRALRDAPVGRWEQHRYRVAAREVTGERRAWVGELDDARTGWARWSLNLTPVATVRSLPLLRHPPPGSRTRRRDSRRRRRTAATAT